MAWSQSRNPCGPVKRVFASSDLLVGVRGEGFVVDGCVGYAFAKDLSSNPLSDVTDYSTVANELFVGFFSVVNKPPPNPHPPPPNPP